MTQDLHKYINSQLFTTILINLDIHYCILEQFQIDFQLDQYNYGSPVSL